ncbi:tetratricopeptide repeat protein [Rhizobiales bacterium]|uniref:tetratricopeptide repeat protein n=1 Tax=Hongsoonwoonella zoysiae TaxID=2821844 RepID=UPI00156159CE|nr:tetratricopeptide repeat protein [Hongsoonwoonella zoysiae]NRG18007.1 tetratricopeptide repeat protein [Hongsoonwoonella zoysiae]
MPMLASSPATLNKLKKAVILQKKGDNNGAISIFKKILQKENNNAEAHNLIGLCYMQIGKYKEAEEHFSKAFDIFPKNEKFLYNYINILEKRSKFKELTETIHSLPDDFNADPILLRRKARALQRLGETVESLKTFELAVRANPDDLDAIVEFAQALHLADKPEEAEKLCEHVLAIDPCHKRATLSLADIAIDQDRSRFAFEFLEQAKTFLDAAQDTEFKIRLANANWGVGRWSEALNLIEGVGESLAKSMIRAKCLYRLCRFEEAADEYRKALELSEDINHEARLGLGYCLLCMGNLEEGFKLAEANMYARGTLCIRRDLPVEKWSGESLAGKSILIWNEQGVGDAIRYASMFAEIIGQAKSVIIEAQPKTVPLLSRNFPDAIVRGYKHPSSFSLMGQPVDYDVHCPIGELPRFLRPTLSSFPKINSFLEADENRVAEIAKHPAFETEKVKVGLCWSGALSIQTRTLSYLSLEDLVPLFEIPNISFFNLQYKDSTDEIKRFHENHRVNIHDIEGIDHFDDLESVAALVRNLDLVISTSSSVSELASALGVPVWRFGRSAEPLLLGQPNMPWLPTTTYYRIPPGKDARAIVGKITADLQAFIQNDTNC